ncbi:hypothetical protein TNCV_77551 [Trichonephila clavipes]|nr:hypothetical protein TNCV_77551 [Trichonephila clavipes]
MAGRRTAVNIDQVRIYHERKTDEKVMEAESSVSSGTDYQSSSFEENRPRLDQSQGFRSSESDERRGGGEERKKTNLTGNQGGRRESSVNKCKRSRGSKESFVELYNKNKRSRKVKECKRRNPSSRSEGPQRKKNRGPGRQMNKRGLPSSANSNWPLNKKRRESKESLQQRDTDPYHLRPRNRVTKEAGSRPSGGEVQVQGGQSGPEENYLRGQVRTTRVDTTGRSPNTSMANSRSRIQGTDIQPS